VHIDGRLCNLHDLQQDDLADHKSNSVHLYQHRLGARLGNQPGHGLDLDSDSIAWLQDSVNLLFSRLYERVCGSLLSVVRGCGQPLDSWPRMGISDTPG